MELSNHINLADPSIRRALYETGKWSKIFAIISGVLLLIIALGAISVLAFAPGVMNEAFLENPILPQSPTYLLVVYSASLILGIFVSVLLFRFGSALKDGGPTQPLANSKINSAFKQLAMLLKYYAIFSVLSLIGSLVMLFL